MKFTFAIVNGPNLNWLGRRETKIYGERTWKEIWKDLSAWGQRRECNLVYFQSNSEGALIDYLQAQADQVAGFVFNPGAYTHTSIALRDCIAMLPTPVIEVHLSAIQRREPFRAHSYIAEVVAASISGFGWEGYRLGLELVKNLSQNRSP